MFPAGRDFTLTFLAEIAYHNNEENNTDFIEHRLLAFIPSQDYPKGCNCDPFTTATALDSLAGTKGNFKPVQIPIPERARLTLRISFILS